MVENKIENKVEKNRDCNINIKNIVGYDDELSKYNIVEEKIENKSKIEDSISDRNNYIEKVYTNQLESPLSDHFRIKGEKIGDKIFYVTKPKNDEAYSKFPRKIEFKFDSKNVKGIEGFKSTKINDIIRESTEKQVPIKIENPYDIKEFLGDYEDPASLFSNLEKTESIYIKPYPFPMLDYNIKLFNQFIYFEMEKIKLRLKSINDNIYIISNEENKDDKYNVVINLTQLEGTAVSIRLNISIRDAYLYDCKTVKEFIKFSTLINDVNSKLIIKIIDSNNTMVNTKDFGTKILTKRQYNEIKKNISLIDKLIYIECSKNIKFKYDYDELIKYKSYIYILYNECQGKNYTIRHETSWRFEFEPYAEIDLVKEQNEQIAIITSFSNMNILGVENIPICNHQIIMNNCKFKILSEYEKGYIVDVTTPKLEFKLIEETNDF